jgi:hypothetical protein
MQHITIYDSFKVSKGICSAAFEIPHVYENGWIFNDMDKVEISIHENTISFGLQVHIYV